MLTEIKNFLVHLRLHYQFFLLSGGYLLGGLMADQMNTLQFWMQFLNVHILLFGGATAYNSWWDKDEGSIGGLKNPPKMKEWMHPVSLMFIVFGWIWSFTLGWMYSSIFLFSLVLFWLYSTPLARWKGHPVLSLIAIAISTGFNSVLLGTLAAGGAIDGAILLGALGASLILLSLYPVSQIYQKEEDHRRGDKTFAAVYGIKAVQIFFTVSFITGSVLLCTALFTMYPKPTLLLFVAVICSWLVLNRMILNLQGLTTEYETVMKAKFLASLSFVIFLIISNAIRYEWIGETILLTYFKS